MRKKASRGTGLHIESLDSRRLFASTLQLGGTSGADEIYVFVVGNYYQVSNNDVITNYPINSVSGISIAGGNGNDDLEVNMAVNVPVSISGGNGDDIVFGGSGNDVLYGNDGLDYMRGKNGNDFVDAGNGANGTYSLTYGDNGNDTIYGGNQDDKMYGGTGSDTLYGNDGRNIYCGNDGDNNDDGAVDYFNHDPDQASSWVYGQPNDVNTWTS